MSDTFWPLASLRESQASRFGQDSERDVAAFEREHAPSDPDPRPKSNRLLDFDPEKLLPSLEMLMPWATPKPAPEQAGMPGPMRAPSAASGTPRPMPTGAGAASAQGEIDNSSRESFVRTAYPYMLASAGGDQNLAELMLAKAINENGDVGRGGGFIGNNFSGIKGTGDAGSFEADTWEDYGQGRVNIRDTFAAYSSPQAGMGAFMTFLRENPRYHPALQRYQQSGNADQLFEDVRAAGYATDPEWAGKVRNIRDQQVAPVVRGQQQAAPSAASGRPQAMPQASSGDLYPRQDLLDDPDKWAVCGPLGVMAFAAMRGQPVDYDTAKKVARDAGWRPDQGMAGPASQVAALKAIGVPAKLGGIDLELIRQEVRNGNPVGLSSPGTSGHYFTVQGVDDQGRLDLGNSALSLRASGGRRWFTIEELRALGPIGAVDTAIYLDNPASPTPSVAQAPPPNAGAASPPAIPVSGTASGSPPDASAGAGSPLDQARAENQSGALLMRQGIDEPTMTPPSGDGGMGSADWDAAQRPSTPTNWSPPTYADPTATDPNYSQQPYAAPFSDPGGTQHLADDASTQVPMGPPLPPEEPNWRHRAAAAALPIPGYGPVVSGALMAPEVLPVVLETLHAADEWLINNPVSSLVYLPGIGREMDGMDQLAREVGDDTRKLQDLATRYLNGDKSVEPEMRALEATLQQKMAAAKGRGERTDQQMRDIAQTRGESHAMEYTGRFAQAALSTAIAPTLAVGPARVAAAAAVDPIGAGILSTVEGPARLAQAAPGVASRIAQGFREGGEQAARLNAEGVGAGTRMAVGPVPNAGSGGSAWRSATPEEFIGLRARSPRGGFLSSISPQDLQGKRVFVRGAEDTGFTGFALDADGDIQNVFNVAGQSGARLRGAGVESMLTAIDEGGRTLDAFDGFLPDYYHQFGFEEVGRVRFNRDYAPPGWDYGKYGEPDVVLMARRGFHAGDSPDGIRARISAGQDGWKRPTRAPVFDSWDEAAAARGRFFDDDAGAGRARGGGDDTRMGLGESPPRVDPGPGPRGGNPGGLTSPAPGAVSEAVAPVRPYMVQGEEIARARLTEIRPRLDAADDAVRAAENGTQAEFDAARRAYSAVRAEYDEAADALERVRQAQRGQDQALEGAGMGRPMEQADTLPQELAARETTAPVRSGYSTAREGVPRTVDDVPRQPPSGPSLNMAFGPQPTGGVRSAGRPVPANGAAPLVQDVELLRGYGGRKPGNVHRGGVPLPDEEMSGGVFAVSNSEDALRYADRSGEEAGVIPFVVRKGARVADLTDPTVGRRLLERMRDNGGPYRMFGYDELEDDAWINAVARQWSDATNERGGLSAELAMFDDYAVTEQARALGWDAVTDGRNWFIVNADALGAATGRHADDWRGTGTAYSAAGPQPTAGAGVGAAIAGDVGNSVLGAMGGGLVGATQPAETPEEALGNIQRGATVGALGFPAAGRMLPRAAGGARMAIGPLGNRGPRPGGPGASANPHIQQAARQMAGQYAPTGVSRRPLWERIVAAVTDDKAIAANTEKELQALAEQAGNPQLTRLVERMRANPASAANQRLRDEIGPALQEVGDDADWLSQYLTYTHNADVVADEAAKAGQAVLAKGGTPQVAQAAERAVRNGRQFGGGMTEADIAKALQDMQTELGPERWQAVQKAGQAYWDSTKATRDSLLADGIIGQAEHADLTTRFPHAVWETLWDTLEKGPVQPGRLGLAGGKPIPATMGAGRDRVNPLLTTIDGMHAAEATIAKNAAARDLVALRDASPEARALFREIAPDAAAHAAAPGETMAPGYVLRGKERTLTLWENGQARQFVVPGEYANLLGVQQGALLGDSGAAQGVRTFFRVFKDMITTHNPAFQMIVSPARDALEAIPGEAARGAQYQGARGAVEAVGAMPGIVRDYARAIPAAFEGLGRNRFGAEVAALRRAGSGMDARPMSGDRQLRAALRDLQETGGIGVSNPRDAWNMIRNVLTLGAEPVGSRMEMIPRIMAARRAAGRGADDLGQAIAYRDATMDFLRGGWLTRQFNAVVPFLNPTVQGGAQVARLAKKNPAAFTAAVTAGIGVPAMMAEAWNRSDPETAAAYDDIPEYIRHGGIVVMLPKSVEGTTALGEKKPNYLFIPLGSFAFAARIGQNAVQTAARMGAPGMTAPPEKPGITGDPWEMALGMAKTGVDIATAFSPIKGDSASSAIASLFPPVASEIVELGINKDLYRGNTIATDRRDENASNLSKGAAAGINAFTGGEIRPSQVEHFTRGVGGYAATLAHGAVDRATGRQRDDTRPIQDIPVVGGLVSRVIRDTGGQNMEDARSDEARIPGDIRPILREAGIRRDEFPAVPNRYKGAPITRREQVDWQRAVNAVITEEVLSARDSGTWDDPTKREQAVRRAMVKAKDIAVRDALGHLSDADLRERIEQETARKGAR